MATTGRSVLVVLTAVLLATTGASAAFVQVDVPTDSTAMDAHLTTDGDGVWTITYRVELSTADRRAAFEDLEADVAANESAYLSRFRDRMDATIANAENATGRSMAIENLSVSTSRTGVPNAYGLLTYRFRWSNFARVDGETLHAGDALAGLFLDDGTSLTVGWPADYARTSVAPEPTEAGDRSVTWRGPRDFRSGEPRVVVQPASGGLSPWIAVAGLLVGLAALGGAFVWRRGRTADGGEPEIRSEGPETGDAAGSATSDAPSPDLMSNEEKVLELLEEEGGRIKQQQIADRLEWTDAKTSQVVGGLRDEDAVETFRIGRENVVTLPNHEL